MQRSVDVLSRWPGLTSATMFNTERLLQTGIDPGAKLVVDGRGFKLQAYEDGFFVGPHLF